mmetsp:Transcript_36359/g.35250  ORF Transcript_36359/g.35250 Transcript_36359/m.35250 type:complete len:93 (+) Transcript_36359:439-717(+)
MLEAMEYDDFRSLNKVLRSNMLVDVFMKPAKSKGIELQEFSQLCFYLSRLLLFQNLHNEIEIDSGLLSYKLWSSEELAQHLIEEFSQITLRS